MRKRIMSIRDGRLGLVWMGHALGQGQHLLPEQHLCREPVLARTPARILPGLPPTVLSAAAPASGLPTPDVPGSAATHVSPAFDSGRQSRCIRLSRRLEEEDHRVQEVVADHCPPRGPRRNLGRLQRYRCLRKKIRAATEWGGAVLKLERFRLRRRTRKSEPGEHEASSETCGPGEACNCRQAGTALPPHHERITHAQRDEPMGQLKANGRALLSKGVRTRINGRSTNDWSGTERRIIAAAAFGALRFLSGCQKQERVPPVPTEPEVFASPEAAGEAVYNAAKNGDSNSMLTIFDPNAKDVVFSGDPVQDKNGMEHFAANYEEMHRWGRLEKGMLVLNFGADNLSVSLSAEAAGTRKVAV
jgi:hypothetical protein